MIVSKWNIESTETDLMNKGPNYCQSAVWIVCNITALGA